MQSLSTYISLESLSNTLKKRFDEGCVFTYHFWDIAS